MSKPQTAEGYDEDYTVDCERVLVTLLRGLGPWKDSVFLVGGLTPRYLVKDRPPVVPPHAGTLDVDIVISLQVLTTTDAYHTLEENLKKMGFVRGTNSQGVHVSWRWLTKTEHGTVVVLEILTDAPDGKAGRALPIEMEGTISALHIPYSSMVFDHFTTIEIEADLLGGGGVAVQAVKHADLLSFTCLKAIAYDQRHERKDAHDLIYCLEHGAGGIAAVAEGMRQHCEGKHAKPINEAIDVLRRRFSQVGQAEAHLMDGPVAVALFELGEGTDAELRESRIRRQREVAYLVEQLLARVNR